MAYTIIKRKQGFSPDYYLHAGFKRDYLMRILEEMSYYIADSCDDWDFYPQPLFDYSDFAYWHKISNEMTAFELYNVMMSYCETCNIFREMCELGLLELEDLKTIRITSQFRNNKVNSAVGGSSHSLHLFGLAVDFTASSPVINAFYDYVVTNYMKSDENILSHRWNLPLFLHPCEIIKYYQSPDENNSNRIHLGFKFVSLSQKQTNIPY